MRDMLEKLQTISEERDDSESELEEGPEYDERDVDLSQEAVVFEGGGPSVIDNVLEEVHSLKKELALLELDVERLSTHNMRFGTTVRRLTFLKQDADTMARKIHQRAEAAHTRLQVLGERSRRLEEKEGAHAAASRIARTQHAALTRAFIATMADYNKAEEAQRELCRGRLKRQASILGADISDAQLDTLVDKGGEGWGELSQSLQTDGGRSTRWALCQIKGRHKELVELEARLKEVHELFRDMAMLVEQQGSMVDNIEANVVHTQVYIEKVNVHIKTALQYKRSNPCLTCCPCLPCWRRML